MLKILARRSVVPSVKILSGCVRVAFDKDRKERMASVEVGADV